MNFIEIPTLNDYQKKTFWLNWSFFFFHRPVQFTMNHVSSTIAVKRNKALSFFFFFFQTVFGLLGPGTQSWRFYNFDWTRVMLFVCVLFEKYR